MNKGNIEDSVSSRTIEYLKARDKTLTFTASQIAMEMNLADDGPVTGLMSRLKQREIIAEVGRKGKASIYEIVGNLDDYHMRKSPSIGGAVGRSINGTSRKQRLINSLLSLAGEIEKMKGDLSDFSTHEILKELEKRTMRSE